MTTKMSMDFSGIEEKVNEQFEEQNDGQDFDDEPEYEIHPYLKATPTTAIGFSSIEDIVSFESPVDENGVVEQPDGDFALVLNDPEILKGALYRNQEKPDGEAIRDREDTSGFGSTIDYQVFDEDDEHFEQSFDADGNVKGVSSYYPSDFPGEEADGFDEDTVLLVLTGSSGDKIAETLDANGNKSAYYIDGERSRGFWEYPTQDQDDDLDRRPARFPQLRDDVGGGYIYIGWMSNHLPDYPENANPGYYGIVAMDDYEGDNVLDATFLNPISDTDAISDDALYELAWHSEDNQIVTDDGNDPNGPSSDDVTFGTDNDEGGLSDHDVTDDEEAFLTGMQEGVEDGEITIDTAQNNWDTIVDNNSGEDATLPSTADPDVLLEVFNDMMGEN